MSIGDLQFCAYTFAYTNIKIYLLIVEKNLRTRCITFLIYRGNERLKKKQCSFTIVCKVIKFSHTIKCWCHVSLTYTHRTITNSTKSHHHITSFTCGPWIIIQSRRLCLDFFFVCVCVNYTPQKNHEPDLANHPSIWSLM